ncbi:hypothetical protein IW261DRAFT_1406997 [Armillaria novae-zelandiae]|uniref:Heterokaryon incompatibility domain-containing protein n=1 Tax=Armillaria novae-zelandiae TaxID=153914 RepID=A0AA39NL61_9AGAR|nr:hypothetical protein IW261DRAFT_1406997 [Armillaria novae-zelandiae]
MDTEGESHSSSAEASQDLDDKDNSSSECNIDETITLSSLTEANKEEATIPVLKQRSYRGTREVIPSALADTLCANLGVDGLLEKLNTTLGTSYGLVSVISILDSYITQNVDFGTAYAYLRPYWYDIPTIKQELSTREGNDSEMRRNSLIDGRITTEDVPPRRVWDLYANRVVPYWVVRKYLWGISHAWVDDKDRVDVMTPINGYEWPVPIPKDTNLDLIRLEMLNARSNDTLHVAEYAWLDVLCLRQEGGKGEALRVEEWKLDVPTIGRMYALAPNVVCYFNGLGRPLDLKLRDFESDRSWFRRAWTLQEITCHLIIGGELEHDVMEKEARRKFDEKLASLQKIQQCGTTLDLAAEMQHRVAVKPVDKVAGLVYLLPTDTIPIYDAEQSEADAWEVLMDVMEPWFRAELLFFFPEPGNGRRYWRPSWEQVMTKKLIPRSFAWYPDKVYRMEDLDADYYQGYRITSGNVQGLGEILDELDTRQGELAFNDITGTRHTLKIVAEHEYLIPDGLYALIGCVGRFPRSDLWVVGELREDGVFKKLSVMHSSDDEQVKLMDLALGQRVKIFLC